METKALHGGIVFTEGDDRIVHNWAQPTGFMYTDPLLQDQMYAFWKEHDKVDNRNQSKPIEQQERLPQWSEWFQKGR